jgi:hypothetical protein
MVIDVVVSFAFSVQTYLFQGNNPLAETAPELHLSLLSNPLFLTHSVDNVAVMEFVDLSEVL